MTLYVTDSAKYRSYLAQQASAGPAGHEVLSAHSTIAALASTSGGTAVFKIKHYLRYAQMDASRSDQPAQEWSVSLADAGAARPSPRGRPSGTYP